MTMPMTFAKMDQSTLRERIADALRTAILDGSLKEGSRIVERGLAAQFHTSLTAVREALIRLEAEGFVSKRPNAATYVIKLSAEGMQQIFEVRRVLETYTIEKAAMSATPGSLARLEAAFLSLMDVARTGNTSKFILSDYAFHELIWSMSGNEHLAAALKRVTPPVFAFTAIRLSKSRALDLIQDANSHAALVDAIKKKDPVAARSAFLRALDEWQNSTSEYVIGLDESAKV
jgi:DNA-binding GntR family transcriptional regulator